MTQMYVLKQSVASSDISELPISQNSEKLHCFESSVCKLQSKQCVESTCLIRLSLDLMHLCVCVFVYLTVFVCARSQDVRATRRNDRVSEKSVKALPREWHHNDRVQAENGETQCTGHYGDQAGGVDACCWQNRRSV